MIQDIQPDTPGIYVIGPDDGPYKVGMSRDLRKRLRSIELQNPMPMALHRIWPIDEPSALERQLHEALAAHRSHGEWFICALPVIDAAAAGVGLCDESGRAIYVLPARVHSGQAAARPKSRVSQLAAALDLVLTEPLIQTMTGATTRLELLARWDAEERSARQQARAILHLTKGSKSHPDGVKVSKTQILNWQRARREGLQQQPPIAIAS